MEVFKLEICDFENQIKIIYNKRRDSIYKLLYFVMLNFLCVPILYSGISKKLYLISHSFIVIVLILFFYFLVLFFLIYKHIKLKNITIQFKNEIVVINNNKFQILNFNFIKLNKFTTDFGGETFQIILHFKNQKIIINKILEERDKNIILNFLLKNLKNCKVVEEKYLFHYPWLY